ncbi:hypothetical protein ACEQ8H_004962 [Pleosporales sp. CAS-2024a]
MPPKTVEEQLAELEMEAEAPAPPPKKAAKAARPRFEQDADALRELEELEALEKFQRPPEAPRPASRPNTPKLPAAASTNRRTAGIVTPSSTGSTRTSEDHPAEAKPAAGSWWGGGWGGILSQATEAASAAKKQAEAAYQELQKHQEAQRWAEQVRGNVGALRTIGGELGQRALPTFTNILHTLAPPISQHERLQIHITHDLIGYPSLDPIIYQTFSSVMAQVEGGDLMVVQRGSESTQRSSVEGYRGGGGAWNHGPWWRDTAKRDLSVVKGLVEGTKLVRVSAEAYAIEHFAARGGFEQAAQQATEVLSETNPVRSSDIFLAIQALSFTTQADLFATSSLEEKSEGQEHKDNEEQVAFAVYLHDPIHGISFKAISQSFPAKWAEWLDAPANTEAAGDEDEAQLPHEIQQIMASGGVDPREWVSEWMQETLSLSLGIVAQRYVARRMGVGEGSLGRATAREALVEAGGGEAARAGII